MTRQMLRALSLSAFAACLTAPAQAQVASVDARWQPYLGCWGPITGVAGIRPETPRVCVTPAPTDGPNAVTFTTVVNGAVVDRTVLNASGQPRPTNAEGCTGTETLQWSSAPGRLYYRADQMCSGGLSRRASGIIALSGLEWIDVRRISSGASTAVLRTARYRPMRATTDIPADVVAQLPTDVALAVDAARIATAGSLVIDDVVDAAKHADAPVVEAWLAERQQRFDVNASALRTLAAAKVPTSVIDVVVAVSYPDRFSIQQPSMSDDARATASSERTSPSSTPLVSVVPDARTTPHFGGYFGAYDPFWGDMYSPYARYSPYGMYSRYSPYGSYYSPYSYYSPSQPVVVIVNNPGTGGVGGGAAGNGNRAYVDRNQGYTQGGTTNTSSGSSNNSTTSSGSSSSGASSSGGSSGGTGGAPPPARTAKARGGGGE
jgi:uncharacterized membrane protein YgcG